MIRFLHSADWQIGRQYGQFDSEDGAVLAEARLDTVAAIARLAAERQVDAVLVAGDVFDTQGVSERTIRRLFAALAPFGGPWVLLAGNHDALLADSVWTRARALGCIPDNVHVPLASGLQEFPALRLAILAAPLLQRQTWDDVTALFDAMDSPPGFYRLGLAHGSVSGRLAEGIDSSNRIAAERAASARLDYLALGDWHGCLQVNARTWYAGTPEQDRFRGNEPGFVLEVSIEAPGKLPEVSAIPIGRYRWLQWTASMVVASDVDALAQRLAELDASHVLQLTVDGRLNLQGWERLQQVVAVASARVRALRFDASAVQLEADQHDLAGLGADGYVAELALELSAQQRSADAAEAAVAAEALRLLLQFQRDAVSAERAP